MKKLRLKALSLGAREILSREQLKQINGGCSSDDDCTAGGFCQNGNCWGNSGGSDSGSSSPTGSGNAGCLATPCGDVLIQNPDKTYSYVPGCPLCTATGGFVGCIDCSIA